MTPELVSEQAARMVRAAAAPAEGLSIKAQIRKASQALGLPYCRTRKLWYGEARVQADEWIRIEYRLGQIARRATEREKLVRSTEQLVTRAFPHGAGEPSRRDIPAPLGKRPKDF